MVPGTTADKKTSGKGGAGMAMYLGMGLIFGLSSGLAPGPMLTLVLAETLRHGFHAGARTAMAPLVTDIPIVGISLAVVSGLSGWHPALGLISLAGALFLVYSGYETFSSPEAAASPRVAEPQSLRKGVVTNFLNPHPYLFWITVGSPTAIRAWSGGAGRAVSFVAGFYLCLVGSKVVLAALADKGRYLLGGSAHRFCMRGLGVLLWLCAVLLAMDGIGLLRA
jgi:threonine/homoserine/homoserine lactone efflux protein